MSAHGIGWWWHFGIEENPEHSGDSTVSVSMVSWKFWVLQSCLHVMLCGKAPKQKRRRVTMESAITISSMIQMPICGLF